MASLVGIGDDVAYRCGELSSNSARTIVLALIVNSGLLIYFVLPKGNI